MSPVDASFLYIEGETQYMHIASVGIFEGPPPGLSEILEMVSSKLHRVPRYRQVVRFVPFDLGSPVWTDDPHFNLRYHVRHTALPAPGGEDQLRNLVGRVMAQRLDRGKPLWEMWIVEGLEDGRWAMLSKTHHCMVDGVAGTDLLAVIMDLEPNAVHEPPPDWVPESPPSDTELISDAVRQRVISPAAVVRGARDLLRAPRRLASQLRDLGTSAGSLAHLVEPVDLELNGPVGPHRRWDWARTSLADIRTVRRAFGGTVNDVVLSVIAKGFRNLLRARRQDVEDKVVRSLIPVSVRREDERGHYDNRVSVMFADLPVGIEDPLKRLESIRAQMDELKEKKQAVAAEALTALTGFAPPMILGVTQRVLARLPQRNVQTVTTNVPGPQIPMYAAGRKMLHAMPYVPLAASVRIGIAIFSYNGEVSFGVTGDYDTAPDIHVLCHGIEEGMEELLKRAAA